MRIDTQPLNSFEKSRSQVATQKAAAPFSRGENQFDLLRKAASDRMLQNPTGLMARIGLGRTAPPSCYRAAYNEAISKNEVGLMQPAIPYYGKFINLHIENGVVRMGFDPATVRTDPVMTLATGGRMTHSKDVSEQECIHMATILWSVAHAGRIEI